MPENGRCRRRTAANRLIIVTRIIAQRWSEAVHSWAPRHAFGTTGHHRYSTRLNEIRIPDTVIAQTDRGSYLIETIRAPHPGIESSSRFWVDYQSKARSLQ